MNEYRYKLASNKVPKLDCPYCGAKKHWQRYIDIETGEILPEYYGCCDNQNKCGKWNNPYKDGYAREKWEQEKQQGKKIIKIAKPETKPKPVFIPNEILKQTLSGYEQNTFIQSLLNRVDFPFEIKDIEKVISLYWLGTIQHGYRTGAITFPFIDKKGNIRAVQVKQFNETNHTTGTDFLHSIIEKDYTRNDKPLPEWLKAYNKNEKRITCLFGEHLLSKYPRNPVALVEAPKTATYGTLHFGFPKTEKDLVWLAVYNKSSFSFDKIKVLKGRTVYIFPDLSKDGSTFKEWEIKAKDYEKQLPGTRFIFSDLIEMLASDEDRTKGYDIADFLIKLNWKEFRNSTPNTDNKVPSDPKTNNFSTNDTEVKKPNEKTAELTGKGSATVSKINTIFISEHEDLKKKVVNSSVQNKLPVDKIPKEQPDNWESEISELETYFSNIKLPTKPVKLNAWTTIIDPVKFVDSSLACVKNNNGNRTFLPYLNSLKQFKKLLA